MADNSSLLSLLFSQFFCHKPDIKLSSSPPSFHIFLYSSFLHSVWWPSLPPPSVFFLVLAAYDFTLLSKLQPPLQSSFISPHPKSFPHPLPSLHHSSCTVLMMLVGINQSLLRWCKPVSIKKSGWAPDWYAFLRMNLLCYKWKTQEMSMINV